MRRMAALALALLCPAAAAAAGPSARLAALEERYLDALFRAKPHLATYMGDHRFDGDLPDATETGHRRRAAELAAQRRELTEIAKGDLAPAQGK